MKTSHLAPSVALFALFILLGLRYWSIPSEPAPAPALVTAEVAAPAPSVAPQPPATTAARRPFKVRTVEKRPVLEPLDIRDLPAAAPRAELTAAPDRQEALTQLQKDVPGVQVTFSPLSGAPSRIIAVGKYLTAPAPGVPAKQVVASFVNRYAGVFGHKAETLEKQARVTMEDTTEKSGLQSLVWEQELSGIRLFRTNFIVNLDKDGRILSLSSQFLPSPEANRAAPFLPAGEAVVRAAADLGDSLTAAQVQPTSQPEGAELRQTFQASGLSDTFALLTYLPMNQKEVRLGWDVTLTSLARNEMFRLVVDASSGEVLVRSSLTTSISDATYNVFADASTKMPLHSPSPMHPTHQTPLTTQPPIVPRQSVTLSALDTTASPNGWVADGANPETIGNNVAAHADADGNNSPDLPRPNGGSGRNFDFPIDFAQAPSTYRNASVVNLFYVNNWLHDRLYGLGFTETARNFQTNNFGRGGSQNDAVVADAQDGSGTNNANFSTPSDGAPGRMQMFIYTGPDPDRDGTLDNQIIVHEYVHGLSNRLVGGGALISKEVTRGMGEGWSDFYCIALLAKPSDSPDDMIGRGAYANFQRQGVETNYFTGNRRYPYGPDKDKNPLTFLDIHETKARRHDGIFINKAIVAFSNQNPFQVHNMGEIWCNSLMEVRRLLMHKHGFVPGNELALQLVTDGMKLSPVDPTFVEARDAIIQADLNATAGANSREIWAGFAKRGMGLGAVNTSNTRTQAVEEAFDVPGDMAVTPIVAFEANGILAASTVPGGSKGYVLKNKGTTPLSWTAAATQTWTTVTPASGTLAAGRSVTITWKLNSTVKDLPAGEKHDILTITDTGSGATQSRPLIFNVNAKPAITTALPHLLRAESSSPSVTYTIDYTGSEKMNFQWYKNGKPITFLSQSLNLGTPFISNAGLYKVKLTNAAGSITSAEAQLAVVNTAARTIPITAGKTLTLTFPYAGKDLRFQWLRNGMPLTNGDLNRRVSGATSPKLTITKFTADDVAAGNDFRCRVSLDTQEITTLAQTVLIRDKPVIAAKPSPPTFMTSDYIAWNISNFISQTNNQTQHLPTSYTIRGLPKGLTYNRTTGFITGYVKVTGLTQVTLTITAANGTGSSNTVTVIVPFLSLPETAYGEFHGLVNRFGNADKNMGASIQFNISNIGTLTGKLRIGTRSYPFSATTYDSNPSGGTFYGGGKIAAGASTPMQLYLSINSATGTVTGSIDGDIKSGSTTYIYYPSLTARRIPWKKPTNLATAYASPYTAALQSTGLSEPLHPLGHGAITATIDTLGKVAATIRLADGTVVTCSTKLADNGQIPIYASAYGSTGSIHGYSIITSATGFWDNAATTLTWRKATQTAGSTRSYVGGITQHNLTLTGGKWIKPVSPTLLLGVTDAGTDNARITFSNAFINSSNLAPGGTFTTPFRIRSSPASSILLPTPKPGGISLTISTSTGLITGSFTTVDDNPLITGTQNITRKAPYAGVIVQRLNQGLGHFNLPRLPYSSSTDPAKTPILSGRVLIATPP